MSHSSGKKHTQDETEVEKSNMKSLSEKQKPESDEGVSKGVSEGVNKLLIYITVFVIGGKDNEKR